MLHLFLVYLFKIQFSAICLAILMREKQHFIRMFYLRVTLLSEIASGTANALAKAPTNRTAPITLHGVKPK